MSAARGDVDCVVGSGVLLAGIDANGPDARLGHGRLHRNVAEQPHAERLRAIWGCEQLTIPDVGHDVAARLRDDAELLPLIDNVMRGAEPSATQ